MNLFEIPSPEAEDLGILSKDVLGIQKCTSIIIDAIDECARSEREKLLTVLQNIMVSCSSIVKVFLAVRQGIAQGVGKLFECHYQASMGSCEADSDMKTYIEDVLAEKIESGKLVVRNRELIDEITDALVQEANGMLVCHTESLLRVLMKGIQVSLGSFQIEDVCRQMCDRAIRETLQKLPRKSTRNLQPHLVKNRSNRECRTCQKIFPWIAVARRPMLLAELREALNVEILQPYSDPERLINDISQIVSWRGNLILLDEQDGTVQFTHQTVKMFLLDSVWDQSNAGFHFKQREMDRYAGEICVTYLNLNDFKSKLIKQPKELPLPTPEAILRATLSVDPSPTSKSIWKKVARLREHRRGKSSNSTHVFPGTILPNDLGAVRELQTEHPFLSYAAMYWLHHSANFERTKPQIWRLLEGLLLSENGPAAMPWKYSEWSQRTRTLCRWICNQEHIALLQ